MSATGMPAYWPLFEPRAPGFLHVAPPYCYRCERGKTPETCEIDCGIMMARVPEVETVAAANAQW